MAAALDHLEAGLAEFDDVAARNLAVERGDAGHLLGADNPATGRRLDLGVAAGVVGMPVGVENQVEPPAQALQFGQDRRRVRRVDAGGLAGGVVADEESVVVGKAGELVDSERHGRTSGELQARSRLAPGGRRA